MNGGARDHVRKARLIHHEPDAVITPNIQMRKLRLVGMSFAKNFAKELVISDWKELEEDFSKSKLKKMGEPITKPR